MLDDCIAAGASASLLGQCGIAAEPCILHIPSCFSNSLLVSFELLASTTGFKLPASVDANPIDSIYVGRA